MEQWQRSLVGHLGIRDRDQRHTGGKEAAGGSQVLKCLRKSYGREFGPPNLFYPQCSNMKRTGPVYRERTRIPLDRKQPGFKMFYPDTTSIRSNILRRISVRSSTGQWLQHWIAYTNICPRGVLKCFTRSTQR